MTAPQLITNATNNITGMFTIFQYVQEVTDNWFIITILFAILIIMFVVFRGASYSNSKPFAASCFFTMVLSILFRVLGFISNKWMYIFITITALSAVWLHLENSQN